MSSSQITNTKHRYFYTDPLAAAWMAKHFGMKFCDRTGLPVSADPSLWYMAERHYQAGSLFIHPDSLHLLEPREGDFLFQIGGGGDPDLIVPDYLADLTNDQPIVTRNSIAFMWPESEAV